MQIPNATKLKILNGSVDFSNDDIRVALYDDGVAFSFDPDVHDFVGDVLDGGTTAQEPSDASYSRQSLSGQSTSTDDTDDEGVFDADNVTFASLSTTNKIQGVVIFKQVTDDTDSPILGVIDDTDDSDLPASTNGTDFVIEWSANGVITASEP